MSRDEIVAMVPALEDYAPAEGYSYLGEPCRLFSYFLPQALDARLNGAARFAGDTGAIVDAANKTDLLRIAVHRYIAELEQKFNRGNPFAAPAVQARGRGTDRAGVWTKVSVNLPGSLRDRIMGASQFARDSGLLPEAASGNRLVSMALEQYLRELEQRYNRGREFKDPRKRALQAKNRSARPPTT